MVDAVYMYIRGLWFNTQVNRYVRIRPSEIKSNNTEENNKQVEEYIDRVDELLELHHRVKMLGKLVCMLGQVPLVDLDEDGDNIPNLTFNLVACIESTSDRLTHHTRNIRRALKKYGLDSTDGEISTCIKDSLDWMGNKQNKQIELALNFIKDLGLQGVLDTIKETSDLGLIEDMQATIGQDSRWIKSYMTKMRNIAYDNNIPWIKLHGDLAEYQHKKQKELGYNLDSALHKGIKQFQEAKKALRISENNIKHMIANNYNEPKEAFSDLSNYSEDIVAESKYNVYLIQGLDQQNQLRFVSSSFGKETRRYRDYMMNNGDGYITPEKAEKFRYGKQFTATDGFDAKLFLTREDAEMFIFEQELEMNDSFKTEEVIEINVKVLYDRYNNKYKEMRYSDPTNLGLMKDGILVGNIDGAASDIYDLLSKWAGTAARVKVENKIKEAITEQVNKALNIGFDNFNIEKFINKHGVGKVSFKLNGYSLVYADRTADGTFNIYVKHFTIGRVKDKKGSERMLIDILDSGEINEGNVWDYLVDTKAYSERAIRHNLTSLYEGYSRWSILVKTSVHEADTTDVAVNCGIALKKVKQTLKLLDSTYESLTNKEKSGTIEEKGLVSRINRAKTETGKAYIVGKCNISTIKPGDIEKIGRGTGITLYSEEGAFSSSMNKIKIFSSFADAKKTTDQVRGKHWDKRFIMEVGHEKECKITGKIGFSIEKKEQLA